MKVLGSALVSLFCAGVIVYVLQRIIPERFEPVLYWSLPMFHKVFHPLYSGPSPQAAFCSLVTDTVLLGAAIFVLALIRMGHHAQKS